MNSCLYECSVMHARLSPRAHRFTYRIFLFALDLEELPQLGQQLRLFSHRRSNLYTFRDTDYLPVQAGEQDETLLMRVRGFAGRHGVNLDGARILLVTLPRIAGYLFNPVSFYFCTSADGRPLAAIAEVTNTFREMKPYFLGREAIDVDGETFHVRVPKHFYVSPFSDVDVAFDFRLRRPAARLALQIDDYIGPDRTLISTLNGERHELTDTRLAWFTVKYPMMSLWMMALIHWQALRLWLKRVPWFAKSARLTDQRDHYRLPGQAHTSASHALASQSD